MNRSHVDRRTWLKGAGVSLALPFMDSLGWAAGRKDSKHAKPPVRLGFMYMPHGVIMDQFWPESPESYLTSPPLMLESLRPVLDQCLMMKGISGVPISPFNGAPHALELSTWLTARLPDADTRSQVNIAISADQIMANYVGVHTLLPSLELAILAFQTDTTRVSTYIGSTPKGVSYPELGFSNKHHSQTHHNFEDEKVRKVAAITKFNIDQYAYMVKKMADLREGDGTLLDNCIMMWGSGLQDGNEHKRENLPFIIAGKGGGTVNTGGFLPNNRGQPVRSTHDASFVRRRASRDRPIGIATKQINEMKV